MAATKPTKVVRMATADGRPLSPMSSNDSMCFEPHTARGDRDPNPFSPPGTPDAGPRVLGPRKDHHGRFIEHTVLGDPEEYAKLLAEHEAQERASRPPEPEKTPEPEDLSYLPPDILHAMSALPAEASKAILDAYKARAGKRYVAFL
eukprot:6360629-Pyramimonas_sp.AAC.2